LTLVPTGQEEEEEEKQSI